MSTEKPDARQWFLRIAGKTVFGPVSTPGIVVWAEQGRILPGHEVSSDRETWIPAEQVAELGIAWYIDDGLGNLRGPLNRIAAETILKSGKAPAEARLIHVNEADLSRVIKPGSETRPAEAQQAKLAQENESLRQRVALLDADFARQKETLAATKQAAKQCAALEQERDALQLALAEVEKRCEAVIKNAEKDAKLAQRQIETLKQSLEARDQAAESTHAENRLALDTPAASPAPERSESTDESRIAIERLTRACADAESARDIAIAAAQQAQQESESLRSRLETLQRETEAEAARLREAIAAADQRREAAEHAGDAARAQVAHAQTAADRQCKALEQARDAARAQAAQALEAQTTAESHRLNLERLLEEIRSQTAKTEAAHAEATAQIERLQIQLLESQNAYNDLLNFSNTHEAELQARIDELQKPLTPVERAADACAADPGSAIARILGQEVDLLEKDLVQERDAFAGVREWSTRRQEAIQTRIHELSRILSGEAENIASCGAARESAARRHPADTLRLQAEIASLRATHAQETRLADEREVEFNRKIRALEAEDARMRAKLAESDKLSRANQELAETIRRREQELSQERKQREVEREHYASTQQALLHRIEQFEHTTEERAAEMVPGSAGGTARNQAAPMPARPKLSPWIRLKR